MSDFNYLVSWLNAGLIHQVRFRDKSEAIDFAFSMSMSAHVYNAKNFELICTNGRLPKG